MSLFARSSLNVKPSEFPDPAYDPPPADDAADTALAVLAGGCFWCVEAVYAELAGVRDVVSGYAGGSAQTADYRSVCTGTTEHAEVVQIVYEPARTSFGQLLKIFFAIAHDPTQLDRQGNDRGTQYRSAVFYADDAQREIAQRYIDQLSAAGVFNAPIVTRLEPLEAFFQAEDYHQNYAANNSGQGYIQAVALPKVEKLRAFFGDALAD